MTDEAMLADENAEAAPGILPAHANGHFYSPIVDPAEVSARAEQLWPTPPSPILGIDFDDDGHRRLLEGAFARFMPEYDYPEHLPESAQLDGFYTQNSQFSWLDARAYFVLLREWRPKRVLEVGSGFSTLLAVDVKRRFLPTLAISCVEPYPRDFLERLGHEGDVDLIVEKVQDVPLERFAALQLGDILFIDSSHVCKTGSDVNYLYFEVRPRFAAGVYIHVHDIFFPHDYPKEWVIDSNRSWNEQYLLRALLMFSSGFEVVFGCNHAYARYPQRVTDALRRPADRGYGGASLWLRRR